MNTDEKKNMQNIRNVKDRYGNDPGKLGKIDREANDKLFIEIGNK